MIRGSVCGSGLISRGGDEQGMMLVKDTPTTMTR